MWLLMHVMISVKLMMTSSNGKIFRVTGHLCGEFSGHRGIISISDQTSNGKISQYQNPDICLELPDRSTIWMASPQHFWRCQSNLNVIRLFIESGQLRVLKRFYASTLLKLLTLVWDWTAGVIMKLQCSHDRDDLTVCQILDHAWELYLSKMRRCIICKAYEWLCFHAALFYHRLVPFIQQK